MPTRTNTVERPPAGLVVALQFWKGDQAEAFRLARLLADIEPEPRDDVSIAFCRRADVEMSTELWETSLYVGRKFRILYDVRTERAGTGHPDGSFALWAGTLDQLSERWAGGVLPAHSVFTIEADGVPLRADWLDVLIEAHKKTLAAGKRITGPEMNEGTPHFNGSLMMHFSCWLDRQSLHRCPTGQAWDLFHAQVLGAEGRASRRIENIYGAANYSDESLRALSREVAWLSSSKDETAIQWAERTLPRRVRKTEVRRHYATVCHEEQWPALFESMKLHCGSFQLHVLAWDWDPPTSLPPDVARWGQAITFTTRNQFLSRNPEANALPGMPRNANETVCTIRWKFFCDVMADTGQPLTCIDGDMMFFSSPEPVFAEIGDARCAVSPHRFAPARACLPGVTEESHRKFGLYNGGFTYWADRAPLEHMRKLTHQWNYIGWRKIDGREFFGDQGILELIEQRYDGHVIRHHGLNVAPWNANLYPIETVDGQIYVGAVPLILYHYQSLKFDGSRVSQLADQSYCLPASYLEPVYDPYFSALGKDPR